MKNGSPIQFQSARSPPLKFTSGSGPAKVWNRNRELATSNPERPPSPKMVCVHFCGFPVDSQVPLSCVPPWTSLTLRGFTERLWNCSVLSPLFKLVSKVGTRERSCWQRAKAVADNPREFQLAETSAKDPLERMTPPSDDSQNWNGLFGLVTRRC